jgi:hypothetical protein
MRLTVHDLVATERTVDLSYKIESNIVPPRANPVEQGQIKRHTTVLLLRGRPHELPTHEGMWQRSDGRNDLFDQAGQRQSVVPAVGKIALPFLGAKRRSGDDSVAHVVLLRTVDPIITEITKRPGQAVEAFLAVAGADPGVVG